MARTRLTKTRICSALTGAMLATSAMVPISAQAEQSVPLNNHPTRLATFETANVNPQGTLQLYVGQMQTDPNKGGGTGNQTYFGGGSYAVTDRLTFGASVSSYQDPPFRNINGLKQDFVINDVALWGKYQFANGERLSAAAQVSVENFLRLEYLGGRQDRVWAGSVKLPVTYKATDALQLHFTPAVSFLPETTTNSGAFYGTVVTVGAGASYKASERFTLYGSVDVPVSGGNTISSTGQFVSVPLWVAGGRYNLTPRLALDGFVTNGVGMTPATSMWTHWPGGNDPLVGIQATWTPRPGDTSSYRGPIAPVSARQASLQNSGLTMIGADTYEPGSVTVGGYWGTGDAYGATLSFAPDRDLQLDFVLENYSNDGSVPGNLRPTDKPRYMFGPKIRLLDQNNGDAFSLSGRLLFGRQIEKNAAGLGVFHLEAAAGYQVNEKLSVTVSPKIAAFGGTEVAGLGVGANFELFEGFDLIAEATAVGLDATDPTWAAGVRYGIGDSGFAVDASASNAIGRNGIGTLVAQDEIKFSLNVTKTFNLSGWR